MTSTDAHPPAYALAELAEGVLDDAQAGDVRSHVAQCPTCQEVTAQLGQVTLALQSLPPELPLPELVSARMSAALSDEYATRPADLADRTEPAAGDDTPGGDEGNVAWFRRRLPQALAAAASVAVIGLAGYVAATGGGDDSGSGETTAADAAAGQSEADDSAAVPREGGDEAESAPGIEDYGAVEDGGADIDREKLTAAVVDVWEKRGEFVSGCGQVLADDLGQSVIGSAAVGAGVLIVLEDEADAQLDGWLVPTCNSAAGEALTAPVVVPKPQ